MYILLFFTYLKIILKIIASFKNNDENTININSNNNSVNTNKMTRITKLTRIAVHLYHIQLRGCSKKRSEKEKGLNLRFYPTVRFVYVLLESEQEHLQSLEVEPID